MAFRFVMLPPGLQPHWPKAIAEAVPECEVLAFPNAEEAGDALLDADAIYGTIPQALFSHAPKLRWIAAPRAGLGGDWFFPELVESEVVVTNFRGIFDDHLSHHLFAAILAHAKHLDAYTEAQRQGTWIEAIPFQHLPECTLLIIGCGAAGIATAKLAKAFGMTALATDARLEECPDCVDELYPPSALPQLLPRADYLVMLVPETPNTLGMLGEQEFALMKPSAYLLNVGRGRTVDQPALVKALQSVQIAGACLDVFAEEPLPADDPLWKLPNVRITPHIAGEGPHCNERRLEILIENCRRFAAGRPLMNLVDKRKWF
ncbi:D-isomer specific 2-hydroxyacid dehydrogenase [Planctomycetales bacterium 10988]|nr:D-isomer specific 2-hydroxyacid dehydrogenase [Planctomycetales bacterium 10988]